MSSRLFVSLGAQRWIVIFVDYITKSLSYLTFFSGYHSNGLSHEILNSNLTFIRWLLCARPQRLAVGSASSVCIQSREVSVVLADVIAVFVRLRCGNVPDFLQVRSPNVCPVAVCSAVSTVSGSSGVWEGEIRRHNAEKRRHVISKMADVSIDFEKGTLGASPSGDRDGVRKGFGLCPWWAESLELARTDLILAVGTLCVQCLLRHLTKDWFIVLLRDCLFASIRTSVSRSSLHSLLFIDRQLNKTRVLGLYIWRNAPDFRMRFRDSRCSVTSLEFY